MMLVERQAPRSQMPSGSLEAAKLAGAGAGLQGLPAPQLSAEDSLDPGAED